MIWRDAEIAAGGNVSGRVWERDIPSCLKKLSIIVQLMENRGDEFAVDSGVKAQLNFYAE